MAISARIDELKKKFDENPRRYFASLANEYRKAGDLDQALFICQEYLPQQPGHMSGHIVIAQTLYEMGRLPDAKAEFEAALALDPENLIALRHLGDIARQSGDPRTARNWYQRVLEADPRNSEIVDVLASLRTTPMASAPAVSAIPPTPLSNPVMPPPTPLSTTIVPSLADSAPSVERSEPAAEPTPQEPAREEHELLDFESITLGETPLSTTVLEPPTEPASDAPFPVEQSAPDLDLAPESFEADAFAIAAPEATPESEPETLEPPIESATDIELGLVDEELTPASTIDIEPSTLEGLRSYEAGTLIQGETPVDKTLDTEPYYDVLHGNTRSTPPGSTSPTHATPPSDDDFAAGFIEHEMEFRVDETQPTSETPTESHDATVTPHVASTPVEGLESFEDDDLEADFTSFASSTPDAAQTPIASFTPASAATPVSSATPIESAADAPSISEPEAETPSRPQTPSSSSEIFVTETMADLYLSQGHTAAALDIYRKLLEHRPGDPRLTDRLHELELRGSGRASRAATPAAPEEPVAPRGPTIREFLVALVASNPSTADFAPSAPSELASESRASEESISGSIDALFSDIDASSHDAESTSVLAEAFSEHSSDDPMLEGQPTHPASSELSLDQVFKAATPVRSEAQPEGFSFDQFFAGEASSTPASPPNSSTPPADGTDDIAQFNAWLNGLKKT
jgi:tetratricopeptide (TPR) repeat protein